MNVNNVGRALVNLENSYWWLSLMNLCNVGKPSLVQDTFKYIIKGFLMRHETLYEIDRNLGNGKILFTH